MILHAQRQIRRQLGQILMDGGFLKKNKLDLACEKQKRTKELLGQVLVKMGLLKAHDIKTPLMIQEHLSNLDDAVKIAAGERQLLGVLLVESGKITNKQLDMAIAEQKRCGGHLGETFTRLGMLTEQQLGALLDFQHNQTDANNINPLRLGELLVSTGHITRKQLAEALQQQEISHKKIGEVLVEAGYLSPSTLQSAFRMQKMLVRSVLASILSLGLSAPVMASRVTLQWNPGSGSGLAGYKVYYSDTSVPLEATIPIDVSMQTVASIDGLDPGKSYKFAVTAYDTEGAESEYSNIVTLGEQVPPSVAITAPLNATKVSGIVSVNISASDNVEVAKVEFYVNDVLTATETASPYSFSWDTTTVAEGTYTLVVKAYDSAGNVSQSSSTVTVTNDIIAPVVTMTAPANNAVLSGTVTISSNTSDNVGVNLTEFYCNGVLLYVSNVEPYAYNWDTTTVENGTYSLVAVARDNTGNTTQSAPVTVTVNNTVPDVAPPTMLSFKMPASSTSLTVPVYWLSAKDNAGVTGYLISESSTRPLASDDRWESTAPASFTFSSSGTKTAYAWAKDAAGNVSANLSVTVVITASDITAPVLTGFTLPATSTTLTVPVSGLSATDAVGVTGYLVSESSTPPLASDSSWSSSPPASITFGSFGTKTAYAWARDAAGNVSAGRSATVMITVPDAVPPTMSSFKMPTSSTSLTVPVTLLSAKDNTGVTGYLISESSTRPLANDARWQSTAPTSFTFSSTGKKIAYAWAKDAAGNVSTSLKASVRISVK